MKRRTFITVLTSCALPACGLPEQLALRGITMGTTYAVKSSPPTDGSTRAALAAAIDSELTAVSRAMSTYDRNSELSRFNHGGDVGWVPVSSELFDVVDTASRISTLSKGAFDVTVGPLVNLWGFGPAFRAREIPSFEAIDRVRVRVGYRQLHSDAASQAVRKIQPDTQIDLSSIAKGYGVDRIAGLLDARGVDNYLVEVGGEFRAKGVNADRLAWRIAIEEPVSGRRRRNIIELSGHAVATSGDYLDLFEHGGQRYSHVIDPTTARPIDHSLTSVTVVARTAMEADGLATALLVLGPDKGYRLAQTNKLAALFVTRADNAVESRVSDTLRPFVAV